MNRNEKSILVTDIHGSVQALDASLELEQAVTAEGLHLTVKNYRTDCFLVGFRAAGQE